MESVDIPFEISQEEYEDLRKQVAELPVEEACEELLECARYGDVDPVRALLESGMDVVDTCDSSGSTALHKSCANGHDQIVVLLLRAGAKFTTNSSGNTPLHWAAANSHSSTVKLLLDHFPEIDVLQKNNFGRSALTEGFAVKDNTDTTKLLLEHDSASEERLLMGGKEVHGDESKRLDIEKSRTNKSVIHEFQFFLSPPADSPILKIRELPIAHADDPFGQSPIEDTTGFGIWCASLVMARWLAANAQRFNGKTVLELGAGCGVPGLACAVYASSAEKVYVTDLNPTTVDNLKHNVSLNNLDPSRAAAMVIDWDDESTWPREKIDFVIGSDLIYQRTIVPYLRKVVRGLLAEDGRFLYVAPTTGRDGLPEFIESMKHDGVTLVEEQGAPQDYYENPLTNGDDEECYLHFHELASSQYVLYEFRRNTAMDTS